MKSVVVRISAGAVLVECRETAKATCSLDDRVMLIEVFFPFPWRGVLLTAQLKRDAVVMV